ncbi:phage capsid and scaffold [Streptococcus pneumoniae]|nr:phage capsid and scaffold [Streptococcus pneumoniae]CAG5639237.1 phage capsid and scaffold [Streptococcus pneumoniae]
MSEEINATVSIESTETVDTQGNVDSVQEEKHERTFTRAEIGKMLSAERSKWEAEQEAKENEAKKLAKMNADEKQKYQLDQREQELADREKAIARKELTAEAKAMLSERDLPVELVNVVDLTSAETVSESITSIQKAWEESVQKGVSERMKGSAPIKNAQTVQQEVTEKWRKDFL